MHLLLTNDSSPIWQTNLFLSWELELNCDWIDRTWQIWMCANSSIALILREISSSRNIIPSPYCRKLHAFWNVSASRHRPPRNITFIENCDCTSRFPTLRTKLNMTYQRDVLTQRRTWKCFARIWWILKLRTTVKTRRRVDVQLQRVYNIIRQGFVKFSHHVTP